LSCLSPFGASFATDTSLSSSYLLSTQQMRLVFGFSG